MTRQNIAIIGAGSFGIALAHLLTKNGHAVRIWTRSGERAEQLKLAHGNPDKLPGVILPQEVVYTADMEAALRDASVAVLVVPSIHVRETVLLMKPYLHRDLLLVNCAKGIEERTLFTLTGVIRDALGGDTLQLAALSGPSHAEEVGRDLPTAIVAASEDMSVSARVQEIFMSPVFRVYTGSDLLGVELGGSLKNVIALAAGVADGQGYGDNTKAAMITRGIAEITRLGVAMGAEAGTFYGLTGIGDLIVTCASMHSRNRRAGILIGQGMSAEEACAEVKMVVEGVHCARAAQLLAEKYGVSMPIISEVCHVLFDGKSPADAVADLMLRDKKAEQEGDR